MSLEKRLHQLEKELHAQLTPTQEKNVARYLRMAMCRDGSFTEEELGESYAKVDQVLPRLH